MTKLNFNQMASVLGGTTSSCDALNKIWQGSCVAMSVGAVFSGGISLAIFGPTCVGGYLGWAIGC